MISRKKKELANGRRYPRVFLSKGILDFDKIGGLEVIWPGDFKAGVLDVSYIGAAIVKPPEITQKYNKGDILELLFSFANGESNVPFDAEVIRENETSIAVHFPELSMQARKSLDEFLKLKIVGLNTKSVDQKYFDKKEGFNHWFHGPNQTNVYIWGDMNEIKKAIFEVNNEVLTFEEDRFYLSKGRDFLKSETENYSQNALNPEQKGLMNENAIKKVVQDVVSLMGQIDDPSGIVKQLSVKMALALDKK